MATDHFWRWNSVQFKCLIYPCFRRLWDLEDCVKQEKVWVTWGRGCYCVCLHDILEAGAYEPPCLSHTQPMLWPLPCLSTDTLYLQHQREGPCHINPSHQHCAFHCGWQHKTRWDLPAGHWGREQYWKHSLRGNTLGVYNAPLATLKNEAVVDRLRGSILDNYSTVDHGLFHMGS